MSRRRQQPSRHPTPEGPDRLGVDALMSRAVALQHAGKHAAAARLYRRVLAAAPRHAGALIGLGMAASQAGRFHRAIELLNRASAISGPQPGLMMNLGAVHDAAGNMSEAERCYRDAIALAPAYRDPYYNLGAHYLKVRRPDDAVQVFDDCLAAVGPDQHALAYRAHALLDAGRTDAARVLLDCDRFVRRLPFDGPPGQGSLAAFNARLAAHVAGHPSLRGNVMSTVRGRHTGELFAEPVGPMADLEQIVQRAVQRYAAELPDDPTHPVVRWAPHAWRLSCWGVVMADGGHERSHIHPEGWLSGVVYVDLPDLIDDPARAPEGWLRFGEPTPELNAQAQPWLHDYQPRYGTVILFPAYFYHGTVPFRGAARRVCISFDVRPL